MDTGFKFWYHCWDTEKVSFNIPGVIWIDEKNRYFSLKNFLKSNFLIPLRYDRNKN